MDAKRFHLRVALEVCLLILCWLIFAKLVDFQRVPASKPSVAINGSQGALGSHAPDISGDQGRDSLESSERDAEREQGIQAGIQREIEREQGIQAISWTEKPEAEARNELFEQEFQASHGLQHAIKEAWANNGVQDEEVGKRSDVKDQDNGALRVSSGRVKHSRTPLDHAVPQRVENGDLRWTQEGEEIVLEELDRLAYPPSCRTAKILYVTGFCWGQGVTFNWWLKGLRLGMALDRTVIFGECKSTYDGCPAPLAGRFECYFQRPGSCSRADMAGRETVDTWDGLDVLERARALDHVAVVRINQGKYEACIFPESMWQTLVERQAVYLEGGGDVSQADPLAKLLMLSALQTLWLYRPHTNILELATMMREKIDLPVSVPVIGVHIRRADKKGEDPYFKKRKRCRPVNHYCEAGGRWLVDFERSNVSHMFVMSDSDSAIREIVSNPTGSGCPSRMRILFNDFLTERPEARASHLDFLYYERKEQINNFYASLYLLFQNAEHVVVTSSSNVGLMLWQMMAAKYRHSQTKPYGAYVSDIDWLGYDTSPRNLGDVRHPHHCLPRR